MESVRADFGEGGSVVLTEGHGRLFYEARDDHGSCRILSATSRD